MGSFTEIVLSFDFAEDTPEHVLAAFAALATPAQPEGAPALPEPVVEAWDMFEPDWRLAGWPPGQGDPYEHEPWRHDWAMWVSTAMGVQTTPHGLLQWSGMGGWNLDCRFSWKTDYQTASDALAWLAPYVGRQHPERKNLVGYAHYEYAPRPHLFWVADDRWELEDLNPDDDWMW
ncbi:MAG TPA: hypothetical protein VNS55_08460 [Nocardioides sp.]|nr:hypothetical protein [Nocardioides sp.]